VYIGAAKLGEYDESIFCGGSDAVLAQLRVRPFSLILEKNKTSSQCDYKKSNVPRCFMLFEL